MIILSSLFTDILLLKKPEIADEEVVYMGNNGKFTDTLSE